MFYTVKQLDWRKGDIIDREMRLDLCDGRVTDPDTLALMISFMAEAYQKVAVIQLVAGPVEDGLEECFVRTNSIDAPWFESNDPILRLKTRTRSTSVGDIVRVGGHTYYCASVGWIKVSD